MRVASPSSGTTAAACAGAVAAAGGAVRSWVATRSSTMRPSAMRTTRRAWAATSASWVISTTVRPAWCRRASSAMSSALLLLSSAPVGSSARITGGSLTSARAIATRCC